MSSNQPFAVFDIDGTIIRWQLFHAICDAMAKQGMIKGGLYQTVLEARMSWKQRESEESFRSYEVALIEAFDASFKGMPVDTFSSLVDEVFSTFHLQIYTYTRDLMETLKQKGYILFAISGSPDIIVKRFAEHYGFDDFAATDYEIVDGLYTGKKDTSLGKKPELLKQLIGRYQATYEKSIAIGDTESDITMLELAEQPIAFNPSKKLFHHAKQQGWKIVIERKNMIYEMESRDGSYILV